jgi:hypothetical protein
MKISHYDYKERIETQKTKPKPYHFLKHYARMCLNRNHVESLIYKEKELQFFHKMHVGDEFFLSVLYPLNNITNFDVVYDDWNYVEKKKVEIQQKIKSLYEEQELKGINKMKNIQNLKGIRNDISKNPKTIIDVKEDLDKIKNCKSYFYRKFSKKSNIEKYWKEIIEYHRINHSINHNKKK